MTFVWAQGSKKFLFNSSYEAVAVVVCGPVRGFLYNWVSITIEWGWQNFWFCFWQKSLWSKAALCADQYLNKNTLPSNAWFW